MPYFKLYPDIKYIKGEKRATIYLLGHSKTIHLSKYETSVMDSLLSEDIIKSEEKFGLKVKEHIKYLMKNGLGTIYDHNSFSEGYMPYMPVEIQKYFGNKLRIAPLFIQLSDNCNMNCSFCKNNEYLDYQGCNSCVKWKNTKSNSILDENNILKAVEQMEGIDIAEVIFSGGNPFLNWELLVKVIDKLKQHTNPQISIHCPENKISVEQAIILKKYNAKIILNFCTGLQNEELLNKTITILKDYSIHYDINININTKNTAKYEEIVTKAKKYSPNKMSFTELIPLSKSNYKLCSLPTGIERIEDTNVQSFFYNGKYSCMYKKLAISADGNILPCPSWSEALGNISDKNGLRTVFQNDSYMKYWENSKIKVTICKKCENRLSCCDCSNLEVRLDNKPYLLSTICDYNTKNGEWETESTRCDFEWDL